jgi:hypothetical protein
VDFDPILIRHLNSLTEEVEGTGNDLHTILDVLVDDLTAAIPSFLGLDATLTVSGAPITLTTMDTSTPVRSSLLLPLFEMGATTPSTTVIYYAGTPGAFTKMAIDVRRAYDLDGEVVLDQHLNPASRPGIAGLDELTVINQAIGILIGRGRTRGQARTELQRRAHARKQTEFQTAAQLIDHLTPDQGPLRSC